MKLFKYLVIGFVILLIILGAVSFILPSKLSVERSLKIKASKEVVFEQVNNLQNWEKWTFWMNIDTTMELKFFGNEKGEGAGFEWKSDKSEVGSGNLTIIASKPFDSIHAEIEFKHKLKADAYYLFIDSASETNVIFIFKLNLGNNPIARYLGLFMRKRIGNDLENSLVNLKKVIEIKSAISQIQLNSTLTDFKINQFLPLIPKGNCLIFQLSPFWVWGKKAEKSQKNLICQSRIKKCKLLSSIIFEKEKIISSSKERIKFTKMVS